MFTANSMNCLTEALGLALPGNGIDAGHSHRAPRSVRGRRRAPWSSWPTAGTTRTTTSVLPRRIATRAAFDNAMSMDVAMGGSTNTVLHLLAAAHEAELDFSLTDIDALSRTRAVPVQGRAERRLSHRGRAPGRRHPRPARRAGPGRPAATATSASVHAPTCVDWLDRLGHPRRRTVRPTPSSCSTPPRAANAPPRAFSQSDRWDDLDRDATAAASATSPTPTRSTAALRCCAAISPPTAAW